MKDTHEKSLSKVNRQEMEPKQDLRTYVPTTDIYEKEDAILVRCDVPGVPQEQIDIHLDHHELEITATQKIEHPEGYELMVSEYDTGVFRRKFSIPQLINRDNIRARLHNGVLDIELPKAEQAKPRRIEITTGG